MEKLNRFISQLNDNIVKVSYSFEKTEPGKSILISEELDAKISDRHRFSASEGEIAFFDGEKRLLKEKEVLLTRKEVYECVIDGEPKMATKQTANGEVMYIENAEKKFERYSYAGRITFEIGEDELLLGLGQYEDGIFNYRGKKEYLYESNMRIAIPYLITTRGYSIFIDSQSNMIFSSENNIISFEIDTVGDLTYYVIFGDSISEMISSFQELTGKAAMLPKWIYGYVQSKERYQTGEELTSTVKEFRNRHIPLDCIVQDWFTWEDGLWGEKIFDKKRYPNFKGTVKDLHDMDAHLMVSIWPNMSPNGKNYDEFREKNGLLKNSNVYNAFDEECRKLYWQQCMAEIMSADTDAVWCDNSEPFSDADWNGKIRRPENLRCELVVEDSKKSMVWEKLNSFGLYHARGIYENWIKDIPEKRVVNLTRSGYVSSQKYGVILWSGDISARWETMKNQIVEGMKMGLCGNPYWTLDIGGFFVSKNSVPKDESGWALWFWNGDFNGGVKDPGYRELYTRWIQFGCFLPIFRSHGTDAPREPWNFINKDGVDVPFYETIVKYIRLRYRLLPYVYSMGYRAHSEAYIMMRSLVLDFANDNKASLCTDEYMFGDAFLVAPVCEPMYYAPNAVKIDKNEYTRVVYLPKGCGWYDFWTGKYYDGGQEISAEADIETLPLMVREGSIIPMAEEKEHSGSECTKLFINIYEGADGQFDMYDDAGDGYKYTEGDYSLIKMLYDDKKKALTLCSSLGQIKKEILFDVTFVRKDCSLVRKRMNYLGDEILVELL